MNLKVKIGDRVLIKISTSGDIIYCYHIIIRQAFLTFIKIDCFTKLNF